MRIRSTWTLLTLVLAWPGSSAAQTESTPKLARFDVTASAGWWGSDTKDLPGDVYRNWDAAGSATLSFGTYWTEHVKTEIEFGGAGERDFYGTESLQSDRTASRYVYREHAIATRSLSLTGLYQLLHNTWVHPFIGGGLDVDWDRHRTETEIRSFFSTPTPTSTLESQPEIVEHTVRARAALTTGIKVYVARRAFLRTDFRVSFTDGIDAMRWRAGAGIDF